MAKREVRIRMHRQGLGDCFLVTFPRQPKPFHLLLDCGALNSKHYNAELMKEVVRDIKRATGGRLDVLAATHEHWDHISGFTDAREIFDEIEVENVWVAWTEDPDNEAAQQLKKEFKKHKEAVEMALERIPDEMSDKHLGLYRKAITELFGFFGGLGASGKGKTEEAWDYLLNKGRKVYCDTKKRPLELEGVEGVRVYVLGPPKTRLSSGNGYPVKRLITKASPAFRFSTTSWPLSRATTIPKTSGAPFPSMSAIASRKRRRRADSSSGSDMASTMVKVKNGGALITTGSVLQASWRCILTVTQIVPVHGAAPTPVEKIP